MELYGGKPFPTLFSFSWSSLVLAIVAVFAFYFWLKPKPLAGFPHNPIRGILGDVPGIMRMLSDGNKTIYDYYAHLVSTHGPISQMFVGKRVILVLADQNEAEKLLTRSKSVDVPVYLTNIFRQLAPKSSIALLSNDAWKRNRRIFKPTYQQQYRMTTQVASIAEALVKLWDTKRIRAAENHFDADVDLRLATMDSLACLALGSPFQCLDAALAYVSTVSPTETSGINVTSPETAPMYQAIQTILQHLSRGPTMPFSSITFPIYLRLSPTWSKSKNLLRSFIADRIMAARERANLSTDDAECALDILVQQEKHEINSGSSKVVRESEWFDEIMVYFFNGQTPPSAVLSWWVKYIATDLDIQRRLHAEVYGAFGESPVSLEALDDSDKMPLLQAVIAETLRCSTVTGLIVRQLLVDEVILGRPAPKGTELLITTGLFGLQESAWGPDVHQWRPDRWLRPDGTFDRDAGPGGIPFGMGHRICAGQKIGMIILKVFIATLSRAFIFKPIPAEADSWQADVAMTRRPKQCYISLGRWSEAS
ncbi:cytochrome P450 family protein [Ceratobasidium sp. AG-Ba]|nr:cytochrome P450 family protein [Ceratobasidium sp. AG-Ba]